MEYVDDSVFVSSINLGSTCLQVYDLTTGTINKSFRGNCLGSNSLNVVGPADYLISSQKDKPLLQAWAINQHDPLQIRLPVPGRVNALSVDEPNCDYCAVGIAEKIYIYQLDCGLQLGVISSHYQAITCLKFTPCGNYFASAGEDGFVYLWSLASLIEALHKADRPQVQPHYILGQHSDKVTGLCISGSGMRGILITCSLDRTVKVFELVTGRIRHNIIANCGITTVVCNIVGSQLFFAGESGEVWGFNLLPHKESHNLQTKGESDKCHEAIIEHMCLSTGGETLLTGSKDGEVKVWSIVMSESNNSLGNPSVALQRVLHAGRGAITNIIAKRISKEVFNLTNLQSFKLITPFNNQSNVDILDVVAPVAVRREPQIFDPREFLSLASQLLIEDVEDDQAVNVKSNVRKKRRSEPLPEARQSVNDIDSKAYLLKLKNANEELYKVALKHIIGED